LELELERDKRERDARERELRERELREMELREKMKVDMDLKPPGMPPASKPPGIYRSSLPCPWDRGIDCTSLVASVLKSLLQKCVRTHTHTHVKVWQVTQVLSLHGRNIYHLEASILQDLLLLLLFVYIYVICCWCILSTKIYYSALTTTNIRND
jgi:hypothetical protein